MPERGVKRLLFLTVLLFLPALGLNHLAQKHYPWQFREDLQPVPNPQISSFLSLGHQGFLADAYFARVNVYTGSLRWKPPAFKFNSRWAYGMMDLITELDPRYFLAYLFSVMGLIHGPDDVKLARPIIEKGMKQFPESWELPFWLGYDYYLHRQDYETAARYMLKAAQLPDSPKHFLATLLSVLKKGGNYQQAVWVMKEMMAAQENEAVKAILAKRLIQLLNLSKLQEAVFGFHKKYGRYPRDTDELMRSGSGDDLSEDPFGQTYIWDPDRKRVVISGQAASSPGN